jgi:hypothetical protein
MTSHIIHIEDKNQSSDLIRRLFASMLSEVLIFGYVPLDSYVSEVL